MQTADDNSKVNPLAIQLTLTHNIKLVLYFNSIMISNQIQYIWLLQPCFADSLSAMRFLLKKHMPRTQGS